MVTTVKYDELSIAVHKAYYAMEGYKESEKHARLKKQFNVSTSVLWEILGIKDELDFRDEDSTAGD